MSGGDSESDTHHDGIEESTRGEEPSWVLTPGVNGPGTTLHRVTESGDGGDSEEVDGPPPDGDPEGWERWYRELKPLLGYLPMGAYEEDTKRDGILSYSVEWHAAIIGVSIGLAAALGGDTELLMMLVGAALGIGRIQQQFSATVTEHLLREPWYALIGAAVAWFGYGLVVGG